MTGWGICTTVKAPAEQVMAFVAHHLDLGAARIWVHFDDPEDPAHDAVAGWPGVMAVRCDAAYWQATCKRRPERHQNRQSRNMQRVYADAPLDWLAHIDVDEFLVADAPVSEVLHTAPEGAPMLRMAPWEALHDPALPDDIFTARRFRRALPGAANAALRAAAFGAYAPLLPDGVLSHAAGKCFFRVGVSRLEPRLHGAFRAGVRVPGGGFDPRLALLHFHAEDPARWRDRLRFRLSMGAYQFNPALQAHLMASDDAGVEAFYAAVQRPDAAAQAALARAGMLREVDLGLRAKIAPWKDPT